VDLEGKKDGPESWDDDDPHTKPAWHGTLLPKTDADVWLAAAFADYQRIVALEQAIIKERGDKEKHDKDSKDEKKAVWDDDLLPVRVALYGYRSRYLAAVRVKGDVALSKVKSETNDDEWYQIASGKGVLLLDELRHIVGSDDFITMMDEFGRGHAGQRVSAADYVKVATGRWAKKVDGFFDKWLDQSGNMSSGGVYTTQSFHHELDQTLIVYGTADEAASNHEAAEDLQKAIIRKWSNVTVPVKADKEVSDAELKSHHLVLIGRPDCNTIVSRFKDTLPIRFGSHSFLLAGDTYAHMESALIVAGENPVNARYSAVVIAGMDADSTLRTAPQLVQSSLPAGEAVLYAHGKRPRSLVLPEKK
jgi:hypothetical protein